jgi:ComF family protein
MSGNLIHSLRRFAREVGAGMLELAYPSRCLSCQERLPPEDIPICTLCTRRLERASPEMLAAVESALPAGPDVLSSIRALWFFDKGRAAQRIQHALKYGNRPRYAMRLGGLVAEAFAGMDAEVDVVTAVPLHRQRLYERGYNQSEELARGIATAFGRPLVANALTRFRPTLSQTELSRTERWENVRDAFVVADFEAVADRRVLLVDDVITSGATTAAAGIALREAGAQEVHAVAMALARP